MKNLNNLEKCFQKGLLRRVEPSKSKGELSIKQAEEWLIEARKNLKGGAYRSSHLSSYLAFFHAARAVLFRDGVREKSHYCIGVYLEKYSNDGVLEEEWVLLFDRMRSVRHADQYSFQVSPSPEEVKSSLESAEKFVKRIKRLLSETEP